MRFQAKILLFATLATFALGLASCIQDEPLNAECDIERACVSVSKPEELFFQLSDTAINVLFTDSVIRFNVRSHADITALAPKFVLTPGATISPASGSQQDFSKGPVTYTVTSQDGMWQRRYHVSFVPVTVTTTDTIFYDLENYELESREHKFYVWHNTLPDGSLGDDWATGNPGFRISMGSAPPEGYPTVPLENGYDGHAVMLTTRDTGPFGQVAGMPLAAGNLFIGNFDVQNALRDPMQATQFGKPFDMVPTRYEGYYKYTPGATYQNKSRQPVPGMVDKGSIYAVLYRNHDASGQPMVLHGDDVQTNPNIVAIAKVDVQPTTEWTRFSIPFEMRGPIDEQLLAERGYNLTVVFSSSINGDIFEGAIGSQLCVDKVRVICTKEE